MELRNCSQARPAANMEKELMNLKVDEHSYDGSLFLPT